MCVCLCVCVCVCVFHKYYACMKPMACRMTSNPRDENWKKNWCVLLSTQVSFKNFFENKQKTSRVCIECTGYASLNFWFSNHVITCTQTHTQTQTHTRTHTNTHTHTHTYTHTNIPTRFYSLSLSLSFSLSLSLSPSLSLALSTYLFLSLSLPSSLVSRLASLPSAVLPLLSVLTDLQSSIDCQ
jgi:hypothetical protein